MKYHRIDPVQPGSPSRRTPPPTKEDLALRNSRINELEQAIADFLDTDPYYNCSAEALKELEVAYYNTIEAQRLKGRRS